jgi:ribosomal protein L18E
MDNENKTSNPLAEKARNYTISPKDQVWNKLDSRLSKSKKNRHKPLKISRITIITAIIVSLVTIIALIQIIHMIDDKNKSLPSKQQTVTPTQDDTLR